MNDTDYKEINTLIRTYELRLLTNDDMERMLKAPDLRGALDILKGTDYDFDEQEVLRTKDFNGFLMNHLVQVYAEMFAAAPDSRVLELYTLRYSYHNLKVLLKQLFLKENLEHLLIPIGRLPLESLAALVETGENADAHPLMVEGVREAKSDYADSGRIETVTVFMDTYYFRHLRMLTNELDNETITFITDTIIDLYNLTSLVRSLNQGKPRSHLYAILSGRGSIPKQEIINESVNGAVSVLNRFYLGKSYGDRLSAVVTPTGKGIDTLKLDKLMNDILHDTVVEGLYQPFGPLPLLGYLYAKETEVTNLRLLLVGKDNDIYPEVLRERVRKVYGS